MYLPAKECVRKGTWVRIPHSLPVYGVVSVKVNTTDCDSVNMGSIPIHLPKFANVAQMVEQRIENPCVTGSIPVFGTKF